MYEVGEYEQMIKALQGVSASSYLEMKNEGMTLLHHAAYENNLEVVNAMTTLPYFKDIVDDNMNEHGWTPLLWAASKKDLQMVKELIQNGASLMKPKKDGLTVMHIAASQNDIHLLDYAIKNNRGATIDLPNEDGWTPAHLASFLGNFDSLNLLIERGADLSTKNNHKMSCFDEILRTDNVDLYECVYEYAKKVKRNLNEVGTFSPLHLAAGNNGTKCLEFLLGKGEFPNQICNEKDQATPLHFSVLSNSYENTRLLLKYSANPNSRDSMGNTPMHFAVQAKNLSVVRVLDEFGASATQKNNDGICPIDIALTEELKDIKLHFMAQQKNPAKRFRTVSTGKQEEGSVDKGGRGGQGFKKRDQKAYGKTEQFGDKKSYGAKKPYGGKQSYADKMSYGDKKSYGGKKPYGDKQAYGEKKSFGGRKPYGDKQAYGDKKSFGGQRSFGDKKQFGDNKKPYSAPKKGSGSRVEIVKQGDESSFHSGYEQPKHNRRQKQRVSDLVKRLRINYNKLIIKKKEGKLTKADREPLVRESIELIGDKFKELCFKHDGCRIIQSLLKYGNKEQRTKVIDNIKEYYLQLMQQKYAHYLASKAYFYAPEEEQKLYFRKAVMGEIKKLVKHMYASEVLEYIYSLSSEQEKREMVFSFYGNYYYLLKEVEAEKGSTQEIGLKQFLEKKPQLSESILHRVERIGLKLIEKGLTRHTIVQAILYDLFQIQDDLDRIKNISDALKEKLPTLLNSKQGLYVACAVFNVLDAKDRKVVVKSLKEIIKELFTNKIGHLFITHILNTLDDTMLSKKKIISELLKNIDELISDKCYQEIFLGIFAPHSKRYFLEEDIEAFEAYKEYSASKKPQHVRRQELIKIVLRPLETFFEEHIQFYLLEVNKNLILREVLNAIVEFGAGEEHSDFMDELFRQIQKTAVFEKEGSTKGPLFGHPDLHRVLKDLVKVEGDQQNSTLEFSKQLSSILIKNIDEVLRSRATFILLQYVEHENLKPLVIAQLKSKKKDIAKIQKELPQSKGLQILLSKI